MRKLIPSCFVLQAAVAGRKHVAIMNVERVGNYAVRLQFDDLHSAGLFTWASLYDLGANKISHIRRYLKLLQVQGLSRDPRRKPPRIPTRQGYAENS